MAAKKTASSRKRPVSQKRVAVVLASLVATMTLSAGALLLMEGGPVGNATAGVAYETQDALAAELDPAVPLQPGPWQYIIVYESGDFAGSAASLADGRLGENAARSSTVRPKANFHFVIDSARSRHESAMDGELEVGTAWLNQEFSAPYAGWPDIRYHNVSPYNRHGRHLSHRRPVACADQRLPAPHPDPTRSANCSTA